MNATATVAQSRTGNVTATMPPVYSSPPVELELAAIPRARDVNVMLHTLAMVSNALRVIVQLETALSSKIHQ